jgi:hypothetical protein
MNVLCWNSKDILTEQSVMLLLFKFFSLNTLIVGSFIFLNVLLLKLQKSHSCSNCFYYSYLHL